MLTLIVIAAIDPHDLTVVVTLFWLVTSVAVIGAVWFDYMRDCANFWRNIALGRQNLPASYLTPRSA